MRERQLLRSNDSTLWSAVPCQRGGGHSDLFWLQSLNLWQTKKAEDPLVYTWVETVGLVWYASCSSSIIPPLASSPGSCKVVLGVFPFSLSYGSLDNYWGKPAVNQKWLSTHWLTNNSFYTTPHPLTVRHASPQAPSLLEHLNARSERLYDWGLAAPWEFCASLNLVKVQLPDRSVLQPYLWLM